MIYHNHHIVPRHAGGTDEASNIVGCDIIEHAEHHKYRYDMLGEVQDYIAWKALTGQISGAQANIMATKAANTGKKQSALAKQRQILAQTGLRRTQKQRIACSVRQGKEWIVTTPDGEETTVIDLKKYCIAHGLDQGNMMRTVSGK
ncbi:MAG: HNH endonuclease, partial [Chloroflexi bacterium]|nr:HNH endonuclease [Chloroflexota bacterium]